MAVTVVTDDGGGVSGSAGSEFTIPKEDAAELAKGLKAAGARLSAMRGGAS
jgi:hypothetical protein